MLTVSDHLYVGLNFLKLIFKSSWKRFCVCLPFLIHWGKIEFTQMQEKLQVLKFTSAFVRH